MAKRGPIGVVKVKAVTRRVRAYVRFVCSTCKEEVFASRAKATSTTMPCEQCGGTMRTRQRLT